MNLILEKGMPIKAKKEKTDFNPSFPSMRIIGNQKQGSGYLIEFNSAAQREMNMEFGKVEQYISIANNPQDGKVYLVYGAPKGTFLDIPAYKSNSEAGFHILNKPFGEKMKKMYSEENQLTFMLNSIETTEYSVFSMNVYYERANFSKTEFVVEEAVSDVQFEEAQNNYNRIVNQ
jgi:hypothetical protein